MLFGSIKHKRRGTVKKSKYACKMPWIMKQKEETIRNIPDYCTVKRQEKGSNEN